MLDNTYSQTRCLTVGAKIKIKSYRITGELVPEIRTARFCLYVNGCSVGAPILKQSLCDAGTFRSGMLQH